MTRHAVAHPDSILPPALALCLLACLVLSTPAAARTPVRFDIVLPSSAPSGQLLWGMTRAGHEIEAGSVTLATLATPRGPVSFSTVIGASLDANDPPVTAWLCINRDNLESYFPSVGDLFQTTTLRQVDGVWTVQAVSTGWKVREASDRGVLTVHYHRVDSAYDNVGLWTWDEHLRRAPEQNEWVPVGRDDFGLVFQIDVGKYGEPGDGIGLLPRRDRDWQQKDGGDRLWPPSMGRSIYLVQEDNRLYREVPDVSPKIRRVTLDADHHLTVRFSHRLPVADWTPERFKLSTSTGKEIPIKAVYPFTHRGDRYALYSIEAAERFDYPQEAYALDVDGFGTHNVAVGHIVKDPERFFDADARLGATYTKEGTTFAVFAPGALTAAVVIADTVDGREGIVEHLMTAQHHGIWSATVSGDLVGKYYAYELGGIGFNAEEEITDIYAVCTQGRHTRSLIVDLARTDPPGFEEYVYAGPKSPADAVVYEMHVRDFTVAANSGVRERGTYLGLTEPGTHLPDDAVVATGLDHLVELGVTHVQLMPVQDFDNAENESDGYNWGYMPVHFNSPDGWYASTPRGAAKITELKQAIKAFHDRGIGVILDVVYNHTAECAPFEKLVPGYYHRLTPSGNFSNGSGCGNELATEHPMVRKFVRDSVRFWVEEYKLDGFRFDLMGLIDLETMKQIKHDLAAIHPGILVYGEPWTGGPTPLKPITDKQHTRMTGLGAFNDHFRDAIKGGRDGGAPGFIQVGDSVGNVVKGLMGAIHDWSHDPVDAINYFEAHDNLTAWDKLLQSTPDATDELRAQMMCFGALVLFCAQGMPFMHSGQEFCRTKEGSHNSYNLPDEINQIDWQRKKRFAHVVDYHRGMIALRKAHPALRLRTRAAVEQRVSFHTPPDQRFIVYAIDAAGIEGESAERILVLLNGARSTVGYTLPEGEWAKYADIRGAGTEALGRVSGHLEVPAHSGVLLMR